MQVIKLNATETDLIGRILQNQTVIVLVDATLAPVTVRLPFDTDHIEPLTFVKTDSTTNAVTVQTFYGTTTWTISVQNETLTLHNDNEGNWYYKEAPISLDINFSAGCTSSPVVADNGDGTITVSSLTVALFDNASSTGMAQEYTVAGATFTPPSDTSYLVAKYNSGSPILAIITDVTLIDEATIIPVTTIFKAGTWIDLLSWDTLGNGLVNKLHQSIVKTQRYRRESGLALSEYGTMNVSIGSGVIWVGANKATLGSCASATDTIHYFERTGGAWVHHAVTTYNNSQYSNGTNTFSLSAGKYAVNWIYRGVETGNHIYMVLGGGDYNEKEALASQPPMVLPAAITSHAVLVGRIIIKNGLTTADYVQSAFDVTFNGSITTIDHSLVTGLTPNLITLGGADGTLSQDVGLAYDPSTDVLTTNGQHVGVGDYHSSTTEISQKIWDGSFPATGNYADTTIKKTFTANQSFTPQKARIYMTGTTWPIMKIGVQIFNVATGAVVCTGSVSRADFIPPDPSGWFDITFSVTGQVVSGTEYAILFCGGHENSAYIRSNATDGANPVETNSHDMFISGAYTNLSEYVRTGYTSWFPEIFIVTTTTTSYYDPAFLSYEDTPTNNNAAVMGHADVDGNASYWLASYGGGYGGYNLYDKYSTESDYTSVLGFSRVQDSYINTPAFHLRTGGVSYFDASATSISKTTAATSKQLIDSTGFSDLVWDSGTSAFVNASKLSHLGRQGVLALYDDGGVARSLYGTGAVQSWDGMFTDTGLGALSLYENNVPIVDRYNRINSGIEDKSKFTVTYSARKFKVTCASGARYFVGGLPFTQATAEMTAHANTTKNWYFYWDNSGTLTVSDTAWDISTTAQIAYAYYNATDANVLLFDERHPGSYGSMSDAEHLHDHFGEGAYIKSGSVITASAALPAVGNSMRFNVSEGVLVDEDLSTTIAAFTAGDTCSILYRLGAEADGRLVEDYTSTIGILTTGTSPTVEMLWNKNTAGTWANTAASTANRWYVQWVVVWPRINPSDGTAYRQTSVLMAQTEHSSLTSAQSEQPSSWSFGLLSPQEFQIVGKLIYHYVNNSTTTPDIELVEVSRVAENRNTINQSISIAHSSTTGRTDPLSHPIGAINGTASLIPFFDASENGTTAAGFLYNSASTYLQTPRLGVGNAPRAGYLIDASSALTTAGAATLYGAKSPATATAGQAGFVALNDTSTVALNFLSYCSATTSTTLGQNRAGANAIYANGGPLIFGTYSAHSVFIGTNNATNLTIASGGAATFTSSISAGSTISNSISGASSITTTNSAASITAGMKTTTTTAEVGSYTAHQFDIKYNGSVKASAGSTGFLVSGLTAGRVTFAGTSGLLKDDVTFFIDSTSAVRLNVPIVKASGYYLSDSAYIGIDVDGKSIDYSADMFLATAYHKFNAKVSAPSFEQNGSLLSALYAPLSHIQSIATINGMSQYQIPFAGATGYCKTDSNFRFVDETARQLYLSTAVWVGEHGEFGACLQGNSVTNDVSLLNASGAVVAAIPHGTDDWHVYGDIVSTAGTVRAAAGISADGSTTIYLGKTATLATAASWYKIGTVTFSETGQEERCRMSIIGGRGTANAHMSLDVTLRIRQNAAFGTDPLASIYTTGVSTYSSAVGAGYRIKAFITSNAGPTTVDIWVLAVTTNTRCTMEYWGTGYFSFASTVSSGTPSGTEVTTVLGLETAYLGTYVSDTVAYASGTAGQGPGATIGTYNYGRTDYSFSGFECYGFNTAGIGHRSYWGIEIPTGNATKAPHVWGGKRGSTTYYDEHMRLDMSNGGNSCLYVRNMQSLVDTFLWCGADNGGVGTSTAHPFKIWSNNTVRGSVDSAGLWRIGDATAPATINTLAGAWKSNSDFTVSGAIKLDATATEPATGTPGFWRDSNGNIWAKNSAGQKVKLI